MSLYTDIDTATLTYYTHLFLVSSFIACELCRSWQSTNAHFPTTAVAPKVRPSCRFLASPLRPAHQIFLRQKKFKRKRKQKTLKKWHLPQLHLLRPHLLQPLRLVSRLLLWGLTGRAFFILGHRGAWRPAAVCSCKKLKHRLTAPLVSEQLRDADMVLASGGARELVGLL